MKIVRFRQARTESFGLLEGNSVRMYSGSPFTDSNYNKDNFKATQTVFPIDSVRLLSPCLPSKIVCLGVNYRYHAIELNHNLPELPLLFLKPPSAVIGHLDTIILPVSSERIDYEGELGIVIGKKAKDVGPDVINSYILGYTCFNDVTDRIAQKKDGQWTRAKGYDTFAPFGPCIETEISPSNLKIETLVNDEIKQIGNTQDLIFNIPTLVSFISSVMTLMPGDLIATGTPEGIGQLKIGDIVKIKIEGIGTLVNRVASKMEKPKLS
jgi:2-keto-4-pentenoate hydratase/2-oxohepta-3-ene-1,7-dioic acid hydratase in catechol pathway